MKEAEGGGTEKVKGVSDASRRPRISGKEKMKNNHRSRLEDLKETEDIDLLSEKPSNRMRHVHLFEKGKGTHKGRTLYPSPSQKHKKPE